MKYSLRSLMIVAIVAPGLIAGVYFSGRLLVDLWNLPRLQDNSIPPANTYEEQQDQQPPPKGI